MTLEQEQGLKKLLEQNLGAENIHNARINIKKDPFNGWRVAVISDDFEIWTESRRRSTLLRGIDIPVTWLFAGTEQERREAGYTEDALDMIPNTQHPNNDNNAGLTPGFPLWPDALAGPKSKTDPVYPSSLDEDLSPPLTATFYSLRGGVGRSTALAHTAVILAGQEKKVVCLDMDLEAPGLAALFGVEDQVRSAHHGVADLLVALDMGEEPDVNEHLIPVDDKGNLFLIPAGNISAAYANTLTLLDPGAWYRESENPLKKLMARVRNSLSFKPDVILVDSRTGLTTLSAPLIFEQADLAIVVFYPHSQTRLGTQLLVQGLQNAVTYRKHRCLAPEPRFIASPLPAGEIGKSYLMRSSEWVSEWMGLDPGAAESDEILHAVPYSEALAASDKIDYEPQKSQIFQPVADWVMRFLPSEKEDKVAGTVGKNKKGILESLSFSADTTERQESTFFENTFLTTQMVKKALKNEVPLVIGRKGTGKTALFRFLLEKKGDTRDSDQKPCVVHAPEGLQTPAWQLRSDGFRHIQEQMVDKDGFEWKHFWLIYIMKAVLHQSNLTGPESEISDLLDAPADNQWDLIKNIGQAQERTAMFRPFLEKNFLELDQKSPRRVLLFDGLDTGFGNEEKDRDTRMRSLTGLFSVLTEWEKRLSNIHFKIMLREDIWTRLRFENKSHLYGRTAVLKWADQAQFLKVVLKQAFQSSVFQDTVQSIFEQAMGFSPSAVDTWEDARVFDAWNILVGERMAGGKTAFTRNWVWSRLGDANNDHAPRNLNFLFELALEWETEAQKKNPYHRSVIRPRALMKQLPEVSHRALNSLLEEFPELEILQKTLAQIGSTPFKAGFLDDPDISVSLELAKEVGLLRIHEETDGNVLRYTIPELYRWGLNMGRKGPV
jgi:MinD-like ATPase involved in chromosome partitioning or flagellar assembly